MPDYNTRSELARSFQALADRAPGLRIDRRATGRVVNFRLSGGAPADREVFVGLSREAAGTLGLDGPRGPRDAWYVHVFDTKPTRVMRDYVPRPVGTVTDTDGRRTDVVTTDAHVTDAASASASTMRRSVERDVTVPLGDPVAPTPAKNGPADERETPEVKIPARASLAHNQYTQAAEALGTSAPTDREAYDVLRATYEKQSADGGGTCHLPTFETWSRNLREYRRLTVTSRNTPRRGRYVTGHGVVRDADL